MIAGSGVPEVTAAYGLFHDMRTNRANHFDIPELYVSYIAPLGKGLRFDVGKMASHLGSEIIGGYDGYNDEFSRGFIFTSKLTGMVVVVNGWDEFQRYNHGYSWGSQITVTPTKTTTLYFNFIRGLERPKDDHDQRTVGEIVGSWKTTPRLNLGFDAMYGHEENAVAPGHDAQVWPGTSSMASRRSFRWLFAERCSTTEVPAPGWSRRSRVTHSRRNTTWPRSSPTSARG